MYVQQVFVYVFNRKVLFLIIFRLYFYHQTASSYKIHIKNINFYSVCCLMGSNSAPKQKGKSTLNFTSPSTFVPPNIICVCKPKQL